MLVMELGDALGEHLFCIAEFDRGRGMNIFRENVFMNLPEFLKNLPHSMDFTPDIGNM